MKKRIIAISTIATLMTSLVSAQEQETKTIEEVVITDTKFSQNKSKSGRSIEKITEKELEQRKGQSVATVLSQLAGVEVVGNQGNAGKNIDLFVRGGSTSQVLILIDGNPIVDASSITTTYDLRLLPVDQVESIEILKGASSVLYGPNAAAAVINITLKKAAKDKISGSAYLNLGTQNTAETKKYSGQEANQGFSINGTKGKVSFLTSLNSTEVKGLSEAVGADFEEDSFSRLNLNQQLGYKVTERLNLDFFANYDKLKSTYDDGSFTDNAINYFESQQFRTGFSPTYKYNKGEFKINSAFGLLERTFNSYDSWSGFSVSKFKSRNVNVDAFNKYSILSSLHLITGVQFQFFDMNQFTPYGDITGNVSKYNSFDPYATVVFNSNFGFNINTGIRYMNHSVYNNYLIWNFNPSFTFEKFNLKVFGSVGSAVVSPSLYQVYSPYGNLALTPQENLTAELGFEKRFLNNKVKLSSAVFYREQDNSIVFQSLMVDPWGQYQNFEGISRSKGFEVNTTIQPIERVTLTGNYTFVENDEEIALFVAKHRANASLAIDLTKKISWSAQYQFVNHRDVAYYDSSVFTTVNTQLPAYKLFHTGINVQVLPNLSLFGSVQNVFNEDFVETVGFTTRGRNFKLGLNLKF
jgi:vitamin B12 transporter